MSIFRPSSLNKSKILASTSSDTIAAALMKKWWVENANFAKSAALIMQWSRDEAFAILNTPGSDNASGWKSLANQAANDNSESSEEIAA